jgi:hypothetical protein
MLAAEKYRRYAAECLNLSQSMSAPAGTMLLEMAAMWVRLAEYVEANSGTLGQELTDEFPFK